ncbi:hypothetical protein SAMN06295879_3589 [Agreia bicolorata]|uniref:Uncharacterized protein n=1 Tax=Agreia bicolorata TaxID=110935 RepID=A0A1T4YM46_9MICO|nr:hypothetical protein [Agreia bicolorata]SKB02780.1 hypothetical protein SAMN06295879_3589 [Agreia bicolorata]
MDENSILILVIACLIGAPVAIWFLSIPWLVKGEKKRQRQSVKSGVIGSFDEIFHPGAYHAHQIWEAQLELPAPAPTPGDRDLSSGKITITLPPQ